MASSSSSAMISSHRSSSSSSFSIGTVFPYSSIDSLLCSEFRRDTCTGAITYLSFLHLGVRGDFKISATIPTTFGTSPTVRACTVLPMVTSVISIVVSIVSVQQYITHELGSPLYFIVLFGFEFDRSPPIRFINAFLAANFPKSCP